MKYLLLISIWLLLLPPSNAQDVLLNQDVTQDTVKSDFGPNLKRFRHGYLGVGLVLGPAEAPGSDVLYGNSINFAIGTRIKRKLSEFLSVGWDLSYRATAYRLKQDSLKILPTPDIHHRERLSTNMAQLQLYARFNFGKRGNQLGEYLDLGFAGEWGFIYRHYYRDNLDPVGAYGAEQVEVVNKRLVYTNRWQYGAIVRVGSNRMSLYGHYRFSDLFNDTRAYPELPRLVIGVQLNLY